MVDQGCLVIIWKTWRLSIVANEFRGENKGRPINAYPDGQRDIRCITSRHKKGV
jgi:hypothetical protein